MFQKLVLILALCATGSNRVWASTESQIAGVARAPLPTVVANSPALRPGIFEQRIDHQDPQNLATFKQRFWINSEFARGPDSPVIYHVCGEGAADEDYFLRDAAVDHARQLGAHIVYLEHRYYGLSQPYGDWSSEHLAKLTLSNVLADLANFQEWIQAKENLRGKWIVIGGSYSGTLAALYRLHFPQNVVGALAASAPMHAQGLRDSGSGGRDLSSTTLSAHASDRQWTYQSCTLFGFWLAGLSGLFQPSEALCLKYYGVKRFMDFQAYDRENYFPFLEKGDRKIDHVFFTNGSSDPWSELSIHAAEGPAEGIETLTIPGAGHHDDLNAPLPRDSTAVIAARQHFTNLAREWLK